MANIRIKAGVERISNDVDKVVKHALLYSGVSKSEAMFVDNTTASAIEQLARLNGMARIAQGFPPGTDEKLVKAIRKALGFTVP